MAECVCECVKMIVLGRNKANVCTNSAVMEELVCLSSKWNILKASDPAVWHGMSRSEWEKWVNYGSTGVVRRRSWLN